ncbi:MAG: outer membrane beta-barrel protein [Dysgonomonas sp.]
MKKLIFTLAIVACAISVNAQNMWLGGSVGFHYNKTKVGEADFKVTSWNILPEFGYFINENFAIAGRIGYESSKVKSNMLETDLVDYNDYTKMDAFVINPFVRYTFLKGNIGALFIDGGVKAKFGKALDEDLTEYGVGITPGAIINVGNGFSVTAAFGNLGYTHKEIKTKPEKIKNDDFNFGLNFKEVSVGVIYSF